MSNDDYPLPKRHLPKAPTLQYRGEFGNTQQEWEEKVFRAAAYFTVIDFGAIGGSKCATAETFPKAIQLAHPLPRALIYAVTEEGRTFCIPPKEWEKYATIWLSMNKGTVP